MKLANLGSREAMAHDASLAQGLNIDQGKIVHASVEEALAGMV